MSSGQSAASVDSGSRFAIVSDVHGNLVALKAVVAYLGTLGNPRVVHGGDLAFNGPRPAECIDLVRDLDWPGIKGNTDDAVAGGPIRVPLLAKPGFNHLAKATKERIGEERTKWLATLPLEWTDGGTYLTHAAPGDLWRSVAATASDKELKDTFGQAHRQLAVYCHIHTPFVRQINGLTVANSGSVGMPFDGDPRPAVLLVRDGRPEIHRIDYDIEEAAADALASGYPSRDQLAKLYRSGVRG